MNKNLIPSVLFGLAIASMAWSNAAHSALSCLAALTVIVIAPRDLAKRLPQYSKYVAALIALILIGYALAANRERAYSDIKGVWPLANLFFVPIAVCSKNRHAFITTFMYVGGLAAAYSALQYFSLLNLSDLHHSGGHYIATSRIWAFCVCMTTLVAVSFDSFLRKTQTSEKKSSGGYMRTGSFCIVGQPRAREFFTGCSMYGVNPTFASRLHSARQALYHKCNSCNARNCSSLRWPKACAARRNSQRS